MLVGREVGIVFLYQNEFVDIIILKFMVNML